MKKGWQTKTLGDVCDFVGGSQPPKAVFSKIQTADSIRLIQIRDYKSDHHIVYIPRTQAKRFCTTDDIMIGRYGPPIFQILRGLEGAYNVALMKAVPDKAQIDREFLFYFLQQPAILEYVIYHSERAAGQIGVTKETLEPYPIALPPLAEQQRIVGLLDEAFAGLAVAQANAEKNLQNARALFESHLQSVFTEAWQSSELITLADLATDITDGDHLPPPKTQTGVPFITIGNILKNKRQIDFSDTFMVPRSYFDGLKSNKKPQKGDVLYTVTGSFGIPVIVPDDIEFCFQRHIGLVRPKRGINSSWLYYLLLSPQVLKQANAGATGTAQKTVSLTLLRSFVVPRVPLNTQDAIVAKLDALATETQRLESIYQQKLAALAALKKSILQRAFCGEL